MLKHNTDWKAGVVEIDREHELFLGMARQMIAVVKAGADPTLVREAMDVLAQRWVLHAAAEEAYAKARDKDAEAILREDHKAIAAHLLSVRNAASSMDRVALAEMIESLAQTIQKHEMEIDVPLFRMMR